MRTETLSGLTFDRADGTGDFRAVFRVVQTVTDIPILLTPAATEVVAAEGLGVTLDLTAPITVANLLDHMTSMSSQLGWRVRDDVVFVEAGAERGQAMRLALYDVRDLTYARTTFIPPRIDGLPAGDDERPRGSGEGEELRPGIEPDALVEIVRIGTDPSYWDGDSGATIDQTETGYLLIRADEAMHLRIERLLGNM